MAVKYFTSPITKNGPPSIAVGDNGPEGIFQVNPIWPWIDVTDLRGYSGSTAAAAADDVLNGIGYRGSNNPIEPYNVAGIPGDDPSNYSTDPYKWLSDLYAAQQRNADNAATTAFNRQKQLMQMQMDFQREMSDTAIQRQTADLKAAGFNPVLAAIGQGPSGASTPSGASGTAPMGTTVDNAAGVVSLVVQGMRDAQATLDRQLDAAQFDRSMTETERKNREAESLARWELVVGTLTDVAKIATGIYTNSASNAARLAASVGKSYKEVSYDKYGNIRSGKSRSYD